MGLNSEENKDIIYQSLDKDDNTIGTERIIIPVFDIYSRKVGDGIDKDRITIFAYEIMRT